MRLAPPSKIRSLPPAEVVKRIRARTKIELTQQWMAHREELIDRASEARLTGKSYRGFLVGCVLYAYNSKESDPAKAFGILTGFNTKELGQPKTCAEERAIQAFEASVFDTVVGLVVVGQPQRDDVSKVARKTLHPCCPCQDRLRSLIGMDVEAPVLTVHWENREIFEELTVKRLFQIHPRHK